jgi:hypothetical protein
LIARAEARFIGSCAYVGAIAAFAGRSTSFRLASSPSLHAGTGAILSPRRSSGKFSTVLDDFANANGAASSAFS